MKLLIQMTVARYILHINYKINKINKSLLSFLIIHFCSFDMHSAKIRVFNLIFFNVHEGECRLPRKFHVILQIILTDVCTAITGTL